MTDKEAATLNSSIDKSVAELFSLTNSFGDKIDIESVSIPNKELFDFFLEISSYAPQFRFFFFGFSIRELASRLDDAQIEELFFQHPCDFETVTDVAFPTEGWILAKDRFSEEDEYIYISGADLPV